MRGKRSKQYRKLMTQYTQIWGFREPYQCLIDAEMVVDCHKFKYDLLAGLERTLHAKIKPSTHPPAQTDRRPRRIKANPA